MPEKNTSARETQNGTEKLDQSGPSATKVYPDLVPMPARDAPAESRLGERIKYARDNLGLSVEALSRLTKNFDQSDQVGIPASTLMRYEKGDTYPTARELRLLCDALYLPPRWVLYGELENSGRNAEEQSLLLALDSYVRAT